MNKEQIKAAESLKRALKKCSDANLAVDVMTDVGFYVLPFGARAPENVDVHEWYAEHGIDCAPVGLIFDGGAGV